MSFALILIGLMLLIAGVRNKQDDLFKLVKGDFAGPNNFIEWVVALVLVGAIGYIPRLKPFSVALMTLILVVIFLRKGTGFFAQLQTATGQLQGSK